MLVVYFLHRVTCFLLQLYPISRSLASNVYSKFTGGGHSGERLTLSVT
jgi:hypothetical protein